MTDSSTLTREQFADLISTLGAPAHLEVITERQDLLRFGASRVTYQHSEERLTLRTKLMRNGRAAFGTIGSLDRAAVAARREELEAVMAHLPPSVEGDALPEPTTGPEAANTFFAATANATPEDRIAIFDHAVNSLPNGATLGGSIAHGIVHHAVGNSAGLFRQETRTRALLQLVGTLDGRSSYASQLSRDAQALDPAGAVDSVVSDLARLPIRALAQGTYRAVLEPSAVITLLATFGYIALNGRAYSSGESAVSEQMGKRIASALLNLVDDGCDDAGLPTSFDCEGASKERVPLIQNGDLAGVVHNSQSARIVGTRTTGHAAPTGWRFGAGPSPSHLLLTPGDYSDEALIRECGNGLSIQRVDYVRVVHPKQTLVTGTTRDATFWIENGQVAACLPQFRFTLRLCDLLSSIVALGKARERGETVFMESIVAPAILVDKFPVDSIVQL
jgi:predicted Zn-dependent protease